MSLEAALSLDAKEYGKFKGVQVQLVTSFRKDKPGFGVTLGAYENDETFSGVDVGFSSNCREKVMGLQASGLLGIAKDMYGLQIAGCMTGSGILRGVQVAPLVSFNYTDAVGLIAGGVFIRSEDLKGMGIGVIVAGDYMKGLSVGVLGTGFNHLEGVSISGMVSMNDETSGLEICGGISTVDKELNGLQIAPFCYAKDGNYLQIGALTFRGTGKWYTRFSPLVGWHKKSRK